MGFPFLSAKKMGISIEDEGIRYIEASKNKDGVRVHRAGMIPLDKGLIEGGKILNQEAVELQLALANKEHRIGGRKVSLAVPSSFVVIRKLQIPPLPDREVRGLIEVELESSIHLPFSRPYFDYHKLGTVETDPEEGPQDHYLVIAAPGDLIDQYVSLLKQIDLHTVAVDIEPLALYRVLAVGGTSLPQNFMLVQMGLHSINVGIFQQDIPEFMRNIPLDLGNYAAASDEKSLSTASLYRVLRERNAFVSFSDDLSRELERVINFYQFSLKNDGTRIETVYFTGDLPQMEEMLHVLRERLPQFHIHLLPLEHISRDPASQWELQAYTVALGLSLRG